MTRRDKISDRRCFLDVAPNPVYYFLRKLRQGKGRTNYQMLEVTGLNIYLIFELFYKKKTNKTMLACRVICCSHQLDHCIWVYISHQSDFHIRVCILHQSNCLIRVCISHQSYYSIWISYANYSIWVLFLRKWCHWIRGQYTKNDIIQKFWVHLISIMVCGLRESLLDWGWDLSGCERLTFNLFV